MYMCVYFNRRLESFEIGMDHRHWIFLRSDHTAVENGRYGLRVQRNGRCELRGFCTDLLVYILQLDHICLLHGQRR